MIVYKFFCLPASAEDDNLIKAQLRHAAAYRRALVDIENRARILLRPVAKLADKEEQARLRAEIRQAQSAAVRAARGVASGGGLYWGTYLQVEEAVDQAQRTTKLFTDVRRFGAWDEGRVGVQIQSTRPLSVDNLVGGDDSRLRVGSQTYTLGASQGGYRAREDGALTKQGMPRPARLRELQLRVGSDEKRGPIWARFHLLMHRPFPPGVRITHAFITRRRYGSRFRYEACFVLDAASIAPAPQARAQVVGIDIGWRKRPNGMRIAYWVGSDGHQGELVVPTSVLERAPKTASLRGIRDRERDEEAAALVAWVATVPPGTWLDEVRAHMHLWKKMGRFFGFFRRWTKERLPGDEAAYERAATWLKHSDHLHDWSSFNQAKMERQIEGRVRELAVRLAKSYDVIGLEEPHVAKLVKKDEQDDLEQRRLQRLAAQRVQVVAPGRVRQLVSRFAAKYQATLVEVPAAFTTITCASCGHLRQVPDRAALELACEACGVQEDQDRTAARNIASAAVLAASSEASAKDKAVKKLGPRRTRKKAIAA